MTIVWDELYYPSSCWIPSKQISICTRIHEVVEVFHPISPILLIFRTSTDQRLRKEQSVQDACMGCILEGIEGLNSVETASDLHKNSWRYSGFSLQFRLFC